MRRAGTAARRPGAGAVGAIQQRGRGVLAACLALLLAMPAMGFIPQTDRMLKAIAATNRASGRTEALRLTLTMRVGGRDPVARGELVSHPTGLARLELRGHGGRLERYLLSGSQLTATRDGHLLESPRPLLQPFFLLQPNSEVTLRAALETYGVISDAVGLAPCGDEDCFVIGDPRLAAPLPVVVTTAEGDLALLEDALADPRSELSSPLPREAGGRASAARAEGALDAPAPLEGPELALAEAARAAGIGREARLPRLWVEMRGLEVRRIDRADGVFMIVGPTVAFDRLRVPAWFEIHEPGAEPIRFDVDGAVAVNAPPKAFSQSWLTMPAEPGSMPGAAAPGSPDRE